MVFQSVDITGQFSARGRWWNPAVNHVTTSVPCNGRSVLTHSASVSEPSFWYCQVEADGRS